MEQREVCKITKSSRQLAATFQVNEAELGRGGEVRKVDFEHPGSLRFSLPRLSHCSFKAAGPGLSTSWQVLELRHLRYGGSEALGS